MPEFEALSQNVKRIRKELKLSQLEFALECGLSMEIISMIECQKTDPKLSTIQKIAAFTGHTPSELLTLDDINNNDNKDVHPTIPAGSAFFANLMVTNSKNENPGQN